MANKLTQYRIEDTATGKTYTIEGPEGASDDELYSFLEQDLAAEQTSEPPSPYPESAEAAPVEAAPVAVPPSPRGLAVMGDEIPQVVPTQFEGGIANQEDAAAAADYEQKSVFEDADQRVLIDAIRDPSKSTEQIQEMGRAIAKAKGLNIIDLTPQSIEAVREYWKKGGEDPIGFSGKQASAVILGDQKEQIDPGVGDFGAALEEGMAYNPMGMVTRLFDDWTDADLQGGVNKDTLREQYPDLDEETVEGLHDALIGELRQRELGNAGYQVEERDVGLGTRIAGNLIGGASPVDIVPIGRGASFASRAAGAVGGNMAVDAAMQGQDIAYDAQDEFNTGQNLQAGVEGLALQGAFEGVGRAAGALQSRLDARTPNVAPPTSAPAAPISVPTSRKNSKAYKAQLGDAQDSIAAEVTRLTENWKNAPTGEVHPNFSKLDGIENDAIGVSTPDGKMLINTEAVMAAAKKNKVAPEDIVAAVTYHEGLGHHGLLQEFGTSLDATMRDLYENGVSTFKARVDKWMTDNPKARPADTDWIALATEEVLAEMSEAGQLPVKMSDKIINTLKDFGRKMGVDLKYSEREVKSILGMAHSATVNGKRYDVRGNGFKYMFTGLRGNQVSGPDMIRKDIADLEGGARYFEENGRTEAAAEARATIAELQTKLERAEKDVFYYPPEAYEDAVERAEAGESVGANSQVRKDTGWFLGPDRRWRMEIDDSDATFNAETVTAMTSDDVKSLDEILDHPALYDMYPELRDVKFTRSNSLWDWSGSVQGWFQPATNTINLTPKVKDPRGTLLHEIQHWIQEKEGFTPGGNDKTALNRIPAKKLVEISKKVGKYYKYQADKLLIEAKAFSVAADDPLFTDLAKAKKKWKIAYDNSGAKAESTQTSYAAMGAIKDAIYLKYTGTKRMFEMAKGEWDELHKLVWEAETGNLADRAAKTAEEAYQARKTAAELLATTDETKLREMLSKDKHLPFQAYQHLFGEVEARDTANRMDMDDAERRETVPYTSEPEIEPNDYIFDPGNTGYQGSSESKYMREYKPAEEAGAVYRAYKQNKAALANYVPTTRSWDEGKAAARDRGLTAKQIRSAKSIGELDKRLFQYDDIAAKTDEKLAALHEKIDTGQFNMADKANYLKTMFEYNEMTARIFEDQAEIGRALNAMKALAYTKNKLGQLNEVLKEFGGDDLARLADEETFNGLVDQVKYLMNTNNKQGAHATLRAVVKPYWWEYLLSLRHNMMLSGLGTHAKNAKDNALMIARELEESALAMPGFAVRKALQTQKATIKDGVSPQEVAARMYGLVRAGLDAQTWLNTATAFKDGQPNRVLNPKTEQAAARWKIPGMNVPTDLLYAADTFFRAFHTNANLYAIGVREAREAGFTGSAAFQEGANLAAQPSLKHMREAQEATDLALLMDTPSGIIQKLEAAKSIRPNMSGGDQAVALFANIAFPFFRVTDRLLFQQLRRVPVVALLDKNTRADLAEGGAKMDIAIARQLMGGALIYYYWEQAGEKNIVGAGPSDYKKREALEAGGFKENSVIEDGQYKDATALNLSFFPADLQNQVAANVASIRQAYEKGKADDAGTAEALGMALRSFVGILASNSFAENISLYTDPFLKTREDEQSSATANLFGGFASSFIPAIVRQINATEVDPLRRDTTGDKSIGDRVSGRLMDAIPGLSDNLPVKYDLYGDEMQRGRSNSGLNNKQDIKTDEVSVELQKLERTTDSPVVVGAPASFQFEGEQVKLTAEGKQEWQRVQGYYLKTAMKQIIPSEEWKQASAEAKIAIVKDVRKDAYSATKQYMLPILGLAQPEEEVDEEEDFDAEY